MTVDTIAYKAHSKNLIASTMLFIWLILIFMLSGHAMAENNSVPGTLYQFSNPPGYGAVHDDNITSNIYNPAPGASTDGLSSFVDILGCNRLFFCIYHNYIL